MARPHGEHVPIVMSPGTLKMRGHDVLTGGSSGL